MRHSLRACYAHSPARRLGSHSPTASLTLFSPGARAAAAATAPAAPATTAAAATAIPQAQRPRQISQLRLGVTQARRQLAEKGPRMPFRGPDMAMSTRAPGPRFSSGSDESELARPLQALLAPAAADGQTTAADGGRWALIPNGEGLERSFKFKTFAKTWDFMTAVALQCKLKNHHPEWSNVYNTVFIRWTTHNPPGLSALDVQLAGICDALAHDFGEIFESNARPGGNSGSDAGPSVAATSDVGRQLADTVVSCTDGQCCVKPNPKPKPKP